MNWRECVCSEADSVCVYGDVGVFLICTVTATVWLTLVLLSVMSNQQLVSPLTFPPSTGRHQVNPSICAVLHKYNKEECVLFKDVKIIGFFSSF